MGSHFSAAGDQTPGSNVTHITLQGVTTLRPWVYGCIITASGTPEDKMSRFRMYRFDTDDGTGTPVTPSPHDPLDPASVLTCLDNHTVEPSSKGVTVLGPWGVHMKTGFTWLTNPEWGIKMPKVATEGVGVETLSSNVTVDHDVQLTWVE